MGIFEKFKLGFKRSANNIASGLREIIVKKEIDDETLNKIEEFLISSDVGIDAASEIKSIIAEKKIDPNKETVDDTMDIKYINIDDGEEVEKSIEGHVLDRLGLHKYCCRRMLLTNVHIISYI